MHIYEFGFRATQHIDHLIGSLQEKVRIFNNQFRPIGAINEVYASF